jgi:aconitate hydratase
LPATLELPVLLKMGDNISTDEIMPAGARVLPFRSNIPKIAEFAFDMIDATYHERAMALKGGDGHAVVGGGNYGQGSSREHAALAPRYLGLRVVIARNFARIHGQNLVNFGIVPLEFARDEDYISIEQGDVIRIENLRDQIATGSEVVVQNTTKKQPFTATCNLSDRQRDILLAGGVINWLKSRQVRT